MLHHVGKSEVGETIPQRPAAAVGTQLFYCRSMLSLAHESTASYRAEKSMVSTLQCGDDLVFDSERRSEMEFHFYLELRAGAPSDEWNRLAVSAQVQGLEMKLGTRILVVNSGLIAGVVLMFYSGTPMLPLIIAASFCFIFANVLMGLRKK